VKGFWFDASPCPMCRECMRPYERSDLCRKGAHMVAAASMLCDTLLLSCALRGSALTLRLQIGVPRAPILQVCVIHSMTHTQEAQCLRGMVWALDSAPLTPRARAAGAWSARRRGASARSRPTCWRAWPSWWCAPPAGPVSRHARHPWLCACEHWPVIARTASYMCRSGLIVTQ